MFRLCSWCPCIISNVYRILRGLFLKEGFELAEHCVAASIAKVELLLPIVKTS